MKKHPVVLDLETQHTFREFQHARDLGVSVACVYDYASRKTSSFREDSIQGLFAVLEHASYIIGYNVKNFDLAVLQKYYPGDTTTLPTFDLCDEMKAKIGIRPSLGDLLSATLGTKKTGHGLIAIDLYRSGKWDELTRYCMDDVLLTKQLFEFGVREGYVHYLSEHGKEKVFVSWKKYLEENGAETVSLTLPF